MKYTLILIILLLGGFGAPCIMAQRTGWKIADASSGEGIPYATVQLGPHTGTVTNEEGRFSIQSGDLVTRDTLYISSMGYEQKVVSRKQLSDSIIYLIPKPIALEGIYLFDKELTVSEIISKIKDNLDVNYRSVPTRQRLFIRHSSLNTIQKLDVAFRESTIAELNKLFIDSIVRILPRSASYFTESLCDYYRSPEANRLKVIKAAELYDKNNEGSMEALSKRLEKIFRENVKPNSYLKIKSGIFGQKVRVDSILEASGEGAAKEEGFKDPKKQEYHSGQKGQLRQLYKEQFFNKDSKLNFILQSNRYEFKVRGYSNIGDQDVYVLDFTPKRKEDFKGTIFVNLEDFAILRVEYENVRSLRKIRLLGLRYEETIYRGTTLFAKGTGDQYEIQFMEKIMGRIMGINRPLQVIEKNKFVRGRRKQNELSLQLDILNNNLEKYNLVVFNTDTVNGRDLSGVEENTQVEAAYQSRYDPEFWEGYNIMEPNEAIRSFTIPEE